MYSLMGTLGRERFQAKSLLHETVLNLPLIFQANFNYCRRFIDIYFPVSWVNSNDCASYPAKGKKLHRERTNNVDKQVRTAN
jgi:hypothetical protein